MPRIPRQGISTIYRNTCLEMRIDVHDISFSRSYRASTAEAFSYVLQGTLSAQISSDVAFTQRIEVELFTGLLQNKRWISVVTCASQVQ